MIVLFATERTERTENGSTRSMTSTLMFPLAAEISVVSLRNSDQW